MYWVSFSVASNDNDSRINHANQAGDIRLSGFENLINYELQQSGSNSQVAYLKKHYYYAAVMHTDPVCNVLNQGKTTIDKYHVIILHII